jgi:L-2,4-diaminobutyric acid acetyltransferase
MPAEPGSDAACLSGEPTSTTRESELPIRIEHPGVDDGRDLWRLARDSGELDLNSPYCYLLWCRDFSATSVVARAGRAVVGFVTGHVRQDADDTLFVWQVAVDRDHRDQRIGRQMLDGLATCMESLGCRYMEATVTPDNVPSARMFESFARVHGAPLTRTEGFSSAMFPDHHKPEDLIRIGPLPNGLSKHARPHDRRE